MKSLTKTINIATIAASALALSTPAAAQTIANGGFEATSPAGAFDEISGTGTIGAWDVENVDFIGSYWQPQSGANSIDLNGRGMGMISQTITGLTGGTTYIVSFFVSANPDNGFNDNPRTATLTLGSGNNPVSYTLTAANSRTGMDWQSRSYSFVAAGTSAFLSLQSTTPGAFGLAVDSFSISAAPEPATWGMMIVGFGIAGAALRVRRRRPALAA